VVMSYDGNGCGSTLQCAEPDSRRATGVDGRRHRPGQVEGVRRDQPQLTVLPDETVAFYAYNSSKGCEDIKEYSPSGTVKTIVTPARQGGASPAT